MVFLSFRIYGQGALYTWIRGCQENQTRYLPDYLLAGRNFSSNLNAVNNDSMQYTPFILNRKPVRYVLIYGDDPERSVGKLIWSILASPDHELKNIDNIQDLIDYSSSSILTIIVMDQARKNIELGQKISSNPGFVGEVIAFDDVADLGGRMDLMAKGFDQAFSRESLEQQSFNTILLKKVEKAKNRQVNLIMQEEYRRFRAALTASPDAFIVLDSDRRIFFVSEHYKRAYPNVGKHLVRGLPIIEAFELGRVEQGIVEGSENYEKLSQFWRQLNGYVEFTMPDERTWRIKAAPLADGQGTIITTVDVTDVLANKKELEIKSAQLAEALHKEQESSALQKQFIGMVSHEFRTPLAIIDGHAQMLERQEKLDPVNVKARCKTIRSAVSRLVHMMESVLSSNMLKTGHMDPDPAPFNLGQLITELCTEQADLFRQDAIFWDVSGLKNPVVLDSKMMTLIISNLLSNAVKFSSDNPRIDVTARSEGDAITISVADNGIGIPDNEIPQIFDRYFRATTSTGIPGSGIGLNLVKSLVSLQKGSIRVESRVGQGTTMTLHLRNLNS
ncbi:MAG: his Kinase domain protein [Micavibrio sp.]|nr:his Kinase domain protein [Micavibrio sp.]